jgi:hypothetical protein
VFFLSEKYATFFDLFFGDAEKCGGSLHYATEGDAVCHYATEGDAVCHYATEGDAVCRFGRDDASLGLGGKATTKAKANTEILPLQLCSGSGRRHSFGSM